MLSPDSFIVKDGNVFYIDLEEYNSKSDITIDVGDTIKFNYEGQRYMANVATIGSKKNQSFVLDIIKKS
jgi:ribosomal 50S subunit-recycling heat shock protein